MNLTKILLGLVIVLAILLTLRLVGVFSPMSAPSKALVIPPASTTSVSPMIPQTVTSISPISQKTQIKIGAILPDKIISGDPYHVKITVKNISNNTIKNISVYEKASGSGNFTMTHCDVTVTSIPPDFARINVGDLAPGQQFDTTCYGNSRASNTDIPGKEVNWELFYDYANSERLSAGSVLLTLDPTMTFWAVENKLK